MTTSKTLNDRIDQLLEQELDKESMRREIKLLIERVTHPDSFCPQCDDRVFPRDNKMSCINCGYEEIKLVQTQIAPTARQTATTAVPNPAIEAALKEAEAVAGTGTKKPKKTAADALREHRTPAASSEADKLLRLQDPGITSGAVNWT